MSPGDGRSFWPPPIRYVIVAPLTNLVLAVVYLPQGLFPEGLLPGQTFRQSNTLQQGDIAP